MPRKLSNWLRSYLEYTSETESPETLNIWIGLSIIAGALGRNVVMSRGHHKIYPNLFVVLVAPSGRHRKSSACGIGIDILRQSETTKVICDAATAVALLQEMSMLTKTREDQSIEAHCVAFAFASEWSTFIRKDAVFTIIFINLI